MKYPAFSLRLHFVGQLTSLFLRPGPEIFFAENRQPRNRTLVLQELASRFEM